MTTSTEADEENRPKAEPRAPLSDPGWWRGLLGIGFGKSFWGFLAFAVVAGAAAYLVLGVFVDVPSETAVVWTLLGGVLAVGFLTLVEASSHPSRHVELAVHAMVRGRYAPWFWFGALAGVLAPAVLAVIALSVDSTSAGLVVPAAVLALAGMFAAETAFVRAGQAVPLS